MVQRKKLWKFVFWAKLPQTFSWTLSSHIFLLDVLCGWIVFSLVPSLSSGWHHIGPGDGGSDLSHECTDTSIQIHISIQLQIQMKIYKYTETETLLVGVMVVNLKIKFQNVYPGHCPCPLVAENWFDICRIDICQHICINICSNITRRMISQRRAGLNWGQDAHWVQRGRHYSPSPSPLLHTTTTIE